MKKVINLTVFLIFIIISFILGRNYENIVNYITNIVNQQTSCDFAPCPTIHQENNQKKTKSPIGYQCPESGYVDCMPGPYELKWECTMEYLNWARENCPNFKGAAY